MENDRTKTKPDAIDKAFEIGIILKGLDGLIEIVSGLILLLISSDTIKHFANWLSQHELTKDPHDFLANHITAYANHLSVSSVTFGGLYLLSHGVVKVVLVTAVLKQKLWAYPWMIGFLVIFIIYQLYRLVDKFTVGMLLLTIFDLIIVWLTAVEYNRHKSGVKQHS
jgi:uncharacterized membrane protein